jgi:hypothetical protein
MRNLEIIACFRAKQAQGWQYGWVAVEKHEIHRWTNMLKNNTRIVIPRKIIGGQYHKILDDSLIFF